MFLGKLNKINFKKASVTLSFIVLFECLLFPALKDGVNFFSDRSEQSVSGYMLDVLRENRTGLGSLEELKLVEVILFESISHKIDPLFVLALIKTESTFYNWSKSINGALGLMQIKPSTGEELAAELNLKWKGDETLLNPYINVKMGVHYFSNLMERYNDDREVTLAAYNVGPGIVDSRRKLQEGWGNQFVSRVLTNYKDLKERAEF
ncbi:MAG: lytic transglycosylase domain-containing protein [Deltaproteobacteria bacterium]|nr:lytic transglycosylase domain-containing protein [Deltaproteobacteria bacterium]